MTIEQRTASIRDWAHATLNGLTVITGPPSALGPKAGVAIHMFDIVPEAVAQIGRQQRLRAALRYLVTAGGETAEQAHKALGDLLFAAMLNGEFELERLLDSLEMWRAFGLPPQPAFVIRTTAWKDLPERVAPIVKEAVFHVEPIRADAIRARPVTKHISNSTEE